MFQHVCLLRRIGPIGAVGVKVEKGAAGGPSGSHSSGHRVRAPMRMRPHASPTKVDTRPAGPSPGPGTQRARRPGGSPAPPTAPAATPAPAVVRTPPKAGPPTLPNERGQGRQAENVTKLAADAFAELADADDASTYFSTSDPKLAMAKFRQLARYSTNLTVEISKLSENDIEKDRALKQLHFVEDVMKIHRMRRDNRSNKAVEEWDKLLRHMDPGPPVIVEMSWWWYHEIIFPAKCAMMSWITSKVSVKQLTAEVLKSMQCPGSIVEPTQSQLLVNVAMTVLEDDRAVATTVSNTLAGFLGRRLKLVKDCVHCLRAFGLTLQPFIEIATHCL